jgi:NDP-sugar pyrophosphorylase family protein
MNYKVCIKAAGKGTRIKAAQHINKALLPLGDQAVLSLIMNKFPQEVEFVIPVGYRAQLIKDFVSVAHPRRKVTFVDVDKFEGQGSGPGYSLLCCRHHLQCPFIFFACDTVVMESVPEPTSNWIGVASVKDPKSFLVTEVKEGNVRRFFDKTDREGITRAGADPYNVLQNAFIGLAGIQDYVTFWDGLQNNKTLVQGELQVANGLNALLIKGLKTFSFTWFDVGTDENYVETLKQFAPREGLQKNEEFIYFENGRVVKYFHDPVKTKNRVERSSILKGVVPASVDTRGNFYAYEKVEGTLISQNRDRRIFQKFLEFCHERLWQKASLDSRQEKDFQSVCRSFYFDKTRERLKKFYELEKIEDQEHRINGEWMPKLSQIMAQTPWDVLYEGVPVLFHGDPQPENVLVTRDKSFFLIDWREDFGGVKEYGDLYYDLAKIYHALIISQEIIRKNEFVVSVDKQNVSYDFYVKHNLTDFLQELEKFIETHRYDLFKVKLLTALIYLNICPLHHHPYSLLLYFLGKDMLYNLVKEDVCVSMKN